MSDDQKEFAEFWTDVLDKTREVQRKYNNLSEKNKLKANFVRDQIFAAQNLSQVMSIIINQISG